MQHTRKCSVWRSFVRDSAGLREWFLCPLDGLLTTRGTVNSDTNTFRVHSLASETSAHVLFTLDYAQKGCGCLSVVAQSKDCTPTTSKSATDYNPALVQPPVRTNRCNVITEPPLLRKRILSKQWCGFVSLHAMLYFYSFVTLALTSALDAVRSGKRPRLPVNSALGEPHSRSEYFLEKSLAHATNQTTTLRLFSPWSKSPYQLSQCPFPRDFLTKFCV